MQHTPPKKQTGGDNCGTCNKPVKDKGIQCEGNCEKWYHISCVKITTEKYAKIKDLESDVMWFCISCKAKIQECFSTETSKHLEKIETIYQKINDLVTSSIKTQLDTIPKLQKTYADASKHTPSSSLQKMCNTPDIIIRPKNGKQTSTVTKKDVYNKIDPKKLKISIVKTRETEKGELIIKCDKREDIEKIKNEAKKQLNEEYEITTSELRLPRIKIINFDQDISETELENSIMEQNFDNEDNDANNKFKITFMKSNKQRNTKTIYAECSPTIFGKLMERRKVFVNWQRYTLYEDISVPRCYKCQEHYHKSSDCSNDSYCAYCADKHETRSCRRTHNKRCINCLEDNRKYGRNHNTNHEASDPHCPTYQVLINFLRSKINYGQEGQL